MRDRASENDYLSDERVPLASCAQASAMVHENQQEVRIESYRAIAPDRHIHDTY